MNVTVRDGQYESAIRTLKRKMQRAGILKYLQRKKHYISKSQLRTEKRNNTKKTIMRFLKARLKRDGIT